MFNSYFDNYLRLVLEENKKGFLDCFYEKNKGANNFFSAKKREMETFFFRKKGREKGGGAKTFFPTNFFHYPI